MTRRWETAHVGAGLVEGTSGDICADPGHALASAGVWGRIRRLASSTIGAGSRCPSTSASSIAVPETP